MLPGISPLWSEREKVKERDRTFLDTAVEPRVRKRKKMPAPHFRDREKHVGT